MVCIKLEEWRNFGLYFIDIVYLNQSLHLHTERERERESVCVCVSVCVYCVVCVTHRRGWSVITYLWGVVGTFQLSQYGFVDGQEGEKEKYQ